MNSSIFIQKIEININESVVMDFFCYHKTTLAKNNLFSFEISVKENGK